MKRTRTQTQTLVLRPDRAKLMEVYLTTTAKAIINDEIKGFQMESWQRQRLLYKYGIVQTLVNCLKVVKSQVQRVLRKVHGHRFAREQFHEAWYLVTLLTQ